MFVPPLEVGGGGGGWGRGGLLAGDDQGQGAAHSSPSSISIWMDRQPMLTGA